MASVTENATAISCNTTTIATPPTRRMAIILEGDDAYPCPESQVDSIRRSLEQRGKGERIDRWVLVNQGYTTQAYIDGGILGEWMRCEVLFDESAWFNLWPEQAENYWLVYNQVAMCTISTCDGITEPQPADGMPAEEADQEQVKGMQRRIADGRWDVVGHAHESAHDLLADYREQREQCQREDMECECALARMNAQDE